MLSDDCVFIKKIMFLYDAVQTSKPKKIWFAETCAQDLNCRDRDQDRDLSSRDRDVCLHARDETETFDRSRDRLETETSRPRPHPWLQQKILRYKIRIFRCFYAQNGLNDRLEFEVLILFKDTKFQPTWNSSENLPGISSIVSLYHSASVH